MPNRRLTLGWPQRLSAAAQRYGARLDKQPYGDLYDRGRCFLDYNQKAHDYNKKKCSGFTGARANKPLVLVVGDSFAAQARVHRQPVSRSHARRALSLGPWTHEEK
jgi:hypothetical protein